MSKDNKSSEKKELTPQQLQQRKKMLIFPLFFLLFAGSMWFIFAPSGDKDESQPDGLNIELPTPTDEGILGDKRTAYEREAMQSKQQEKMKSLQDFAFMLGENEKSPDNREVLIEPVDFEDNDKQPVVSRSSGVQSSAEAYQQVNRELASLYSQPTAGNEAAQSELESRLQQLEKMLEEKEQQNNTVDDKMQLMEKSFQMAAKYMPGATVSTQGDTTKSVQSKEKIIPQPVKQINKNVVSLLAAPLSDDEFMQQYSKPRNMGFNTAAGNETLTEKNTIKACVYQTVTLSDGKGVQLRLLEPMQAGRIFIPENTVISGTAKISGERMEINITSIQYADNVIPVDLSVYDLDGMRGVSVPRSDEITAVKEIAANMGSSAGSSISITDDAGSQLASDLGRSIIQGASQYVSKKMQTVKVTLKANYVILLLPKA